MVSEHMLTVGRDPRNWQAHRKDFSLQLSFQKDLLPLFSSELIQIFPFSETGGVSRVGGGWGFVGGEGC